MTIKTDQTINYDEQVAEELDYILPQIPLIVLDIETTGNFPEEHGVIDISALDLRNPQYNFSGECRLRDGAYISHKDIRKNIHVDAIERIIDPKGNYPDLEGDDPMIQLNFFGKDNYNGEQYMDLRRSIKSVLKNRRVSNNVIEEDLEELFKAYYDWLQPDMIDPDLAIQKYMVMFGEPVPTPIGHNISFDDGFLSDGFKRTGIGKPQHVDVTLPDGESHPSYVNHFTHPYRNLDTHDAVLNSMQEHIDFIGPEHKQLLEKFWKNAKSVNDKRGKEAFPTLFNTSGLSLDTCAEYVGIPPRINSGKRAKHDSLHDVKITTEVYVRTKIKKPYLEEFKKFPIPQHLDKEHNEKVLYQKLQQKYGK